MFHDPVCKLHDYMQVIFIDIGNMSSFPDAFVQKNATNKPSGVFSQES